MCALDRLILDAATTPPDRSRLRSQGHEILDKLRSDYRQRQELRGSNGQAPTAAEAELDQAEKDLDDDAGIGTKSAILKPRD